MTSVCLSGYLVRGICEINSIYIGRIQVNVLDILP